MNSYYKNTSYKGVMSLLSLLCVLFAALSLFVADVFSFVTAALLAVLMLCERKKGRALSYLIPSVIVALNIATFILCYLFGDRIYLFTYSLAGACAVAVAVALYFLFSKNVKKTESVAVLSAVTVVILLISLWMLAATITGSLSLVRAIDYYKNLIEGFKAELSVMLTDAINQLSSPAKEALLEVYTPAAIEEMLDQVVSYSVSALLVCAFILTGITCKVFTFAVYRITGSSRIYEWRFAPKPIVAYIYCGLFLLNSLFGGFGGTLGAVIANLYTVFMFVFAYVGFGFALELLLRRNSRGFAIFILIAVIFLTGTLSALILSVFGVVATVVRSKRQRLVDEDPFNNSDK